MRDQCRIPWATCDATCSRRRTVRATRPLTGRPCDGSRPSSTTATAMPPDDPVIEGGRVKGGFTMRGGTVEALDSTWSQLTPWSVRRLFCAPSARPVRLAPDRPVAPHRRRSVRPPPEPGAPYAGARGDGDIPPEARRPVDGVASLTAAAGAEQRTGDDDIVACTGGSRDAKAPMLSSVNIAPPSGVPRPCMATPLPPTAGRHASPCVRIVQRSAGQVGHPVPWQGRQRSPAASSWRRRGI